jgi:hypothetical protein
MEKHGWELRPSNTMPTGSDAANYSVVHANAVRYNATYFFVALGADAPSDLYHSKSYWFRQDRPGQLKLAAGNFGSCLRLCMDDTTKRCGYSDNGGGSIWAVYGSPGRHLHQSK